MNTVTVELELSPEQIIQLDEVARTRQMLLAETIQLAVTEWLEKQQRLTQARTLMRKLGQGLGSGHSLRMMLPKIMTPTFIDALPHEKHLC